MINIGRFYVKRCLSKEPKAKQKEAPLDGSDSCALPFKKPRTEREEDPLDDIIVALSEPRRTEREEAPLVGVNAHVELIDYCAQMTQTQRFRNNEDAPLEAIYQFQLPKGCAVSSFSADVGDRHLTGKVKEKEKAAEDYDDAIAAGHSAAMLQSTDEDPNVFSVQLGNIPPGVEAFVKITFEKLANVDEGKIVLTLDGSDAQSVVFAEPPAASPALDARVQPGFHFDVHVPKNSSLGISSPSHPIAIEMNDNGTTVRLAENADWRTRKDFVLEVTIPDPHAPKIRLQKNDNALVAMASFYPKIETKQTKCEMIFVLDRSGSMSGRAIEYAKSTLQFFLRSLPEDAFFNIISFGSTFEMFSSESVPFNDDTLKAASAHVSEFNANLGGTNIYAPLKSIFEKPIKSGYPRQVFILTDGEVRNKESCIELVKTNANTTRLFAFGIGNGVDKDLVNRMARAGEGSSTIIRESSTIRECVMKQLERAIQPGLTDIKITWKDVTTGEPLPEGSVRQTPFNPPPIFRGTRLVSFAVLPEDCPKCKAVLTGSFGDSQYTSDVEVDPASAENVPGEQIIKLAVRSLIEDIQNGCGGIPADKQDEIEKAVVELSVKHSILSKFTAFVAIGSGGVAVEASMITRRVSRRIPAPKLKCPSRPRRDMECVMKCKTKERPSRPRRDMECVMKCKTKERPSMERLSGIGYPMRVYDRMGVYNPIPESVLSAIIPPQPTSMDSQVQGQPMRRTDSETAPEPALSKTLDNVILQQKASGCFNIKALALLDIPDSAKAAIPKSLPAGLDAKIAEDVWITLLVLVGLQRKYAERAFEWSFLAKKSENWVRSKLGDAYDAWNSCAESAQNSSG